MWNLKNYYFTILAIHPGQNLITKLSFIFVLKCNLHPVVQFSEYPKIAKNQSDNPDTLDY